MQSFTLINPLSVLPNELLSLITHLLDLGSIFSLITTCRLLLVANHKKYKNFSQHDIVMDTIRHNNTNLFKWLEYGPISLVLAQKYSEEAALSGSLEILKHVYENSLILNSENIICTGTNIVQYSHNNAVYYAAENGHLDIVKYLHEIGCPWNNHTYYCAVTGGNLEIIKYLHENDCPWSESTCSNAVYHGHMEILKYLHDNGCPWDKNSCSFAAMKGHLNILQYLHENGCPWNEDIVEYAICNGHLDIIQYLHENGCP